MEFITYLSSHILDLIIVLIIIVFLISVIRLVLIYKKTKSKGKLILGIIIFILVLILSGYEYIGFQIYFFFKSSQIRVMPDVMQITEAKAIELANKEAKHIGYNVESLRVKATHYNTPVNEHLPANSKNEYFIERRNKLQNKKYWAVYYYNPQYMMGGDLTIFIDSSNGAVITDIRGK